MTVAAENSKLRRVKGLTCIFLTAVIWIATSFISESLVHDKGTQKATVPPFLLTYLATTLFTLYLPVIHGYAWFQECLLEGKKNDSRAPLDASLLKVKKESDGTKMARTAAIWATPLWFAAQFTFNLSLAYTSVTSNTILSSTSSLFTFGFSILMLGEQYTWHKLVCIFSCMAGTAMVTLADAEGSPDNKPIWGDALVLISGAFYAGYTVMMRKKMPGEEGEKHIGEFFGYVGLFTTVGMAPVLGLLIFLGHVSLASIPKQAYLIILLEGLLDYVLSDYLWAKGVMLLGPTVATLCLSVQIPIAAGAELIVGQPRWAQNSHTVMFAMAGTALIVAGFFGINLASSSSQEKDTQQAHGHAHKLEEGGLLDAIMHRRKSKDSGSGSGGEGGLPQHSNHESSMQGGDVERLPLLGKEPRGTS